MASLRIIPSTQGQRCWGGGFEPTTNTNYYSNGIDQEAGRRAKRIQELIKEYGEPQNGSIQVYDKRVCKLESCKKPYIPHNATQKYCSSTCSSASDAIRYKKNKELRKLKKEAG